MRSTALALLLATALARAGDAQLPCPHAVLPAYAHNDYENTRPLADALQLGFRGVEVDVFLVDDVLHVGHDRRRARGGGTLESLYLQPLAALVHRCGQLTVDGQPFLLAVEIKERSEPTYDSLAELLLRYRQLFTSSPVGSGRPAPVEVVLVGWHPPPTTLSDDVDGPLRLQHRMTSADAGAVAALSDRVRLLSLDHGKTMGRWRVTASSRGRWLAALRSAKAAAPGRLLRVHNVRPDSSIYAALLDAGVDLIGTKDLITTRRLLLQIFNFASQGQTR